MECRKKAIWSLAVVGLVVVVIMVATLVPSKAAEKPATKYQGDATRRCDEVHLSSSYDSTPFGYSKIFFEPKRPALFSSEKYEEPVNLPPRSSWDCGCYVVNRSAVCPDRLDNGIPSCVDAAVEAVFINSTELDRLPVDTFRHLPNLQYIEILYTKIELLGNDLFNGTKDLKHLMVYGSQKLRYLDRDVFRGASSLEHVVVRRTNISSLEPDVFTHLKNLKILDLSTNKITSLPEGIFRDNLELEQLELSENPLLISSGVSRSLLRNNAKLRVLYMNNCGLQELPPGLLSYAHNLEWLDLSGNKISSFPAEFIQECPRLSHLLLEFCGLEHFSSDVLLQHGGTLNSVSLRGNHITCSCDLVLLASWDELGHIVSGAYCLSPENGNHEHLRNLLTGRGALECSAATASLRTDLNRVLNASRAIAGEGAGSVTDQEVGFIAANYFLLGMAARTSADVASVASHWARLLEDVLARRHNLELPGTGADTAATREPPAAAATSRTNGFEPVVNFTHVTRSVPENLTKAVDDGIADELNTVFRYVNATEAKRQKSADCYEKQQHFSGSTAASKSLEDVLASPKKLNATEEVVFGLRHELREFLFTLLKSTDRAKRHELFWKRLGTGFR